MNGHAGPADTAASDTCLRGYKFRLSPNSAQESVLRQLAGASRYTYNFMVGHNRDVQKRRHSYHDQLVAEGVDSAVAWDRVKSAAQSDKALVLVTSYETFATRFLTPEVQRHRVAAELLAAGVPRDQAWPDTELFDNPWLHTVNRRVLVSGLQNAANAFGNYFASLSGKRGGRKVRFPRFKKRGRSTDSYTVPAPESMGPMGSEGGIYHSKVDGRRGKIEDYHHVRLANLGVVRVNRSTKKLVRMLHRGGTLRSFTVSHHADYWYVSFLVDQPDRPRQAPTRKQKAGGAVGVDLGVSKLMTLDNGAVVANPRLLRRDGHRVACIQRKIARSAPGSKNRDRLKRRLAKRQHRLAQRRKGMIHEVTTTLVEAATLIAIEDLNVSGMSSSARGTLEKPGKNVKAKAGLNRSILDASFGEIRRQLDYKCAERGVELIVIDRFFASSQTCSLCGSKTKITLSTRVYRCECCGLVLDRDENAARNIVDVALAQRGFPRKYGRPGTGTTLNGRGVTGAPPPSAVAEAGPGDVEAARLTVSPRGVAESSSRAIGCPSPTEVKQGEQP